MHIHTITKKTGPGKAANISEVLNIYLLILGAVGNTLSFLGGLKG